MTKTKSTKRALLMSGLALLVCVSMLIGSTFAWFTDSVTSAGNIIKSGTLDVEMYWANGTEAPETATWADASTGAIFNYDLWEPGYTEVRHIKIENKGTLALKYQLSIAANGEETDLADVIDVYYLDPAVQVADRAVLTADKKLGTLTEVLANISTTASGNLLAGENDTITLALKMQETAGNEYQGKSIGSEFAVQLMATQLTHEFDSFNNQYDVKATYLNQDADGAWLINNMDELYYFASQVNSGNSYLGETVKLTADIDLAGYNWIPIGAGDVNGTWIGFNGAFDGQNHTISNVRITKSGGWNGIFGLVGRGTSKFTESISNLTVKNVVIDEANRMSAGIVGQLYGNIENCHVENVTINAIPNMTDKGEYDNGDKIGGVVGWFGDNGNNHYIRNCSAKNVTLKAYRDVAGVVGYIGTTTTVENCSADTVSITVDQNTNHYGFKDANAGGVVGRIYGQPVYVQNNSEVNITIVMPKIVSDAAELATTLAAGGTVVFGADIVNVPVNNPAPYGNYYGVAQNGGLLDGNGNILNFDIGEMVNSKFDNYGIMTSGGTIKNADITGVFRGIMIMNPTEDVIIDNITIGADEDMCYGINTGEGNGAHDLIITNSRISGWNSFGTAVKSVSFTNCTFGQGSYYTNVYGRLVKPYVDAVFENCEFGSKYYIDLSALSTDGDKNIVNPDAKIVLKNCTVNGVKLTAENWTSLVAPEDTCGEGQISIEGKDGSYMTASNIFDYVIFE